MDLGYWVHSFLNLICCLECPRCELVAAGPKASPLTLTAEENRLELVVVVAAAVVCRFLSKLRSQQLYPKPGLRQVLIVAACWVVHWSLPLSAHLFSGPRASHNVACTGGQRFSFALREYE